jgi:hypothetical protein
MEMPENVIDVPSEESFAAERVPGARNFCVYEMAFVEKVAAAFPDRATPLTVYGCSSRTREAEEAAASGIFWTGRNLFNFHAGELVAQGTVAFDRTRWGSLYGLGRFFARLGKHVVNDLIDIQVKVVATRV